MSPKDPVSDLVSSKSKYPICFLESKDRQEHTALLLDRPKQSTFQTIPSHSRTMNQEWKEVYEFQTLNTPDILPCCMTCALMILHTRTLYTSCCSLFLLSHHQLFPLFSSACISQAWELKGSRKGDKGKHSSVKWSHVVIWWCLNRNMKEEERKNSKLYPHQQVSQPLQKQPLKDVMMIKRRRK